jgi:N-acetylmuramoyl-L-alanine amidase
MTRILLLTLLMLVGIADAARLDGLRLWTAPDHTRLVFDTSAPADHKVFALRDPDRLVIDLADAATGEDFSASGLSDDLLRGVRYAPRADGLRVVLDLKTRVRPKTFVLKPNASYGHRLVIDLYPTEGAKVARVAKSTSDIPRPRDVVIAVDAGHGGEDPGASGSRFGTREKEITLQIAKRLKRLIDAQPGMRAVLTRTGDYSVSLRKRIALAREHRADLFISIHADAFRDRNVHGSSVYVLSRRGASSEAARWLASRENAADLVGGITLDDKDDVLASVLLDLSQSATQHASLGAAEKIYEQLTRVGKVHGKRVQQAGFVVLKSPDIPSILVETGFISNPDEETNLRNPRHQERVAQAVMRGVEAYFKTSPPPGTQLAEREAQVRRHVIERGDTLSEIALRYGVSLARLREHNGIRSDRRLLVGQVLVIPDT